MTRASVTALRQPVGLAVGHLVLDQQAQPILEGQCTGFGAGGLAFQRADHAAQAEGFHLRDQGLGQHGVGSPK
ncbi:MAG: hypothetical protein ACREU7_10300 [Burkholderiales bacterium]